MKMTKTKLGKSDIPILLTLSSILVAITIFGLLFSVIPASGDAPPPIPHTVEGKVCYSDDTPVQGASVTLNNTRTGEEVQGTTDENGEWSVEVANTIHAITGDEILITAFIPDSVEKKKSKILVVNTSEEPQIAEDFVFEKQSESPGDGSSGGSSSGGTTPVPTPAEAKTNAADTDTEQQPSPSQSESIEDEGESETPSPLLEDGGKGEEGTGKSKGIPGFQILYAGLAGLIAIVALFSIRKLRRSRGGEKR